MVKIGNGFLLILSLSLVGSCGLYGWGLGKRVEEKQILFKKGIKDEAIKTIKYWREIIKKVIPKITNLLKEKLNKKS